MPARASEYKEKYNCADCRKPTKFQVLIFSETKDTETHKILKVKKWVCLFCFNSGKYSPEEKYFKYD